MFSVQTDTVFSALDFFFPPRNNNIYVTREFNSEIMQPLPTKPNTENKNTSKKSKNTRNV